MHTTIAQQVEELIFDSYESMYRMAYSYVRNEDDAMDIVQESVYKAIKGAPGVNRPDYLKTWLFRIVIHTSIDFIRKNKQEISDPILAEPSAWDAYTDFDTIEALDVLNERERAVIVLHFFEDRTLAEVAKILDLNVNTAKTTMYRSLKKLKIKLTEGEPAYEGF